jgi:hypothetical protein
LVIDGFPRTLKSGATIVGRLRKVAVQFDLPPAVENGD